MKSGRADPLSNTPTDPSDCTQVEKIFEDADHLFGQWKHVSLLKALEKYSQVRRCQQITQGYKEEAGALKKMGDIYYVLSEYPKARSSYEEALRIRKIIADDRGEAEALNDLGFINIYLNDTEKSIAYCTQALSLSRRANDKRMEARSHNSLGFAYYMSGQLTKAVEQLDRAVFISNEVRDNLAQAQALLSIGYLRTDAGELVEALSSYQKALQLWETEHHLPGQSRALAAIGGIYTAQGEAQQALDYHQRALRMQEQIGDRGGLAITLNNTGYAYETLGDNKHALGSYLRALGYYEALENLPGEAQTCQLVGTIYRLMGDTQKSREYYERGMELSLKMNDKTLQALSFNNVGMLAHSDGLAQKALNSYRRAHLLYRQVRDPRGEVITLNNIGHVYQSLGERQTAFSYYKRALPLIMATEDRELEVPVRYNIAQAERDLGNLTEARAQAEAALRIIESLRTKILSHNLRGSYFATVRQHYELYTDILMQLNHRHPGEGFDTRAFDASERARARSFLELLEEARLDVLTGVDDSLLQQERAVKRALNAKAERHMQLHAGGNKSESETVAIEVDKLTAEHEQIKARIRTTSRRYAALMQPQPQSLKELQNEVLDENTLLLEYMLGDERSYLWAVTRTEATTFELPGRAKIEESARNVYDLLTASQPIQGERFDQRQTRMVKANERLPSQIADLSRMLLEPVAAKLGTKRLLIVADGALQYIPFQILNKAAEPRPLVADHEIVNQPSASALALLISETERRKPATNSVAVLADPVFEADDPRLNATAKSSSTSLTTQVQETDFHQALRDVNLSGGRIPRLLASRDEADAIMAAAPWWSGFRAMGFEASRATAMRSDLGDYRIVHFATHGFLNDEHPELSGVVLSLFDEKGQAQEGFLRLHDIYNLKLPVDLVVLSACNTGLGKDVRGEGLIGLTRGFMYAGASSVVASLWKVDDEATAELMRYFYRFMLKDGLSPAAALRKAQIEMSKQKRWQSPYYWSGFIIQGQYIPTARVNDFRTSKLALFGGVAVVLVIAIFFAWKQRRTRVL